MGVGWSRGKGGPDRTQAGSRVGPLPWRADTASPPCLLMARQAGCLPDEPGGQGDRSAEGA
ncbi:hypothetical protein BHS05_33190 [Myxococcus xanthus]|uniref:Uncharacterized protein n=1 Tax=Myxococcus xanthus TaxID=34 RepID=A0AAE6G5S1_MYXXA|nr:hypothetical protein BHS09_33330 [Myxococcus xanthus]QDE78759.1 hypothetical protein BHS08_33350 [Myxococcus xanthus]QDF00305.1 hypothetical protein BHS05_33190 [Myxococcus xanthus]QDF08079.1 hypothetical protein BHS04_33455 [Myxococcus xanthus]